MNGRSSSEKNKNLRPLIGIGMGVAAIMVVGAAFVAVMFGSELRSLATLQQIDGTDAYTMEYTGDYGFDEFMQNGATSDADVVDFVSSYFLHGIPVEFELPDFGCSAFFARTPEGEFITARNFDFDDTPVLVLKTSPKNGYNSLSTVDLNYLGFSEDYMPSDAELLDKALLLAAIYAPMDGINEKGLTISVLQVFDEPTSQATGKPGITTSTAIRMILDKAATVDEALEYLSRYDMHSSAGGAYHFLITDATGRSVVVEYIRNECHIVEAQSVTNSLIAPVEHSAIDDGKDRHEILDSALNETAGVMTEDQAMDVLRAARFQDELYVDMKTQWSVVFGNTNKTATYCFKTNYDRVVTYSVEEGVGS